MQKLLQKLPFPVEFAIVLAGAFGLAIGSSLLALAHIQVGMASVTPEMQLWRTVALEAITLAILGLFLKGRGWTLSRLGLVSHWSDGLWGVALAAGCYYAVMLVLFSVDQMVPGIAQKATQASAMKGTLSIYLVGAIVLVTSFYQEVFVTGYVISALKEKGLPNAAFHVSIALRLAYHLYYGTIAVVMIIPIGLIFAFWFTKRGQLWPVIVAHALINLISYAPMVKW